MSVLRLGFVLFALGSGTLGCKYVIVPDAPKPGTVVVAAKPIAPAPAPEPALPLGNSWDVPESMKRTKIRNQGKGIKKKIIALTFDDGPSENITPQVLDILDENKIKATFFLMGIQMHARPALVKEIIRRGHAVGNHTYTHARNPDQYVAEEELKNWDNLFKDITKRSTGLFRPPFGNLKSAYSSAALKAGYPLILWTNTGADTSKHINAEKVYKAVMEQLKPGDIVLLHDSKDKQHTATALPNIIKSIRDEGYSFVTVPEMLKEWDSFTVENEKQKPTEKHTELKKRS